MRRKDDLLELLTWDSHTYANDDRYSLVQEAGDRWRRWRLVVRDAQTDDEGQYRCQVATQPPLVLTVTLSVTEPRARVVDERGTKVLEKHYNSGSMIELKCVIERVPFPPAAVAWRRDATLLSFNTSRGGISVKGDPTSGFIRSQLYVREASPSDSGVYSCWYGNYTKDTVTVHVLAGENSAAMQHDSLPGGSASENARGQSSGGAALTACCPSQLLLALLTSYFSASSYSFRSGDPCSSWIFLYLRRLVGELCRASFSLRF
ncbi:zwei Ig domain protein zig-8-like [Penaeus vannamei]|uniref:zwei Ig domain protein zig-8-like n=1 Tax=Penaeus vannamei TaxID=6689 RepID=UPI00387F75E1